MAITLWQKIRLATRVWWRRSAERSRYKREEFIDRETSWGRSDEKKEPQTAGSPPPESEGVDVESVQVAWLDESGAFVHFLDTATGDVVDVEAGSDDCGKLEASPGHRRIPTRTPADDVDDRRLFLESLDRKQRRHIDIAAAARDSERFRREIARDHGIERSWFTFRNDRALEAIERWLIEG